MDNKFTTPYILTADVGGSHITTAICDIKNSRIIESSVARAEFNSKDEADSILHAWIICFQQSMQKTKYQISGLGIAMPGPFDYDNGISYIKGFDKFEALYGLNIKEYLAGILQMDGDLIKFRNDTEALISGEVWADFGKRYKNIVGVSFGTGFGSAQYADSATVDTCWGSFPYRDSIADDYFSTRWFVKRYFELTKKPIKEVKELVKMKHEDPIVMDIFAEFAINLSSFLAERIKEVNPELLIVCGNISKASDLFLPYLREKLSPLPVEVSRLGENAALFGVASLFDQLLTVS